MWERLNDGDYCMYVYISDVVHVVFRCKDGFEIKRKFLLDGGRIQLEQVKQAFSLETVEIYIGKTLYISTPFSDIDTFCESIIGKRENAQNEIA